MKLEMIATSIVLFCHLAILTSWHCMPVKITKSMAIRNALKTFECECYLRGHKCNYLKCFFLFCFVSVLQRQNLYANLVKVETKL